MNWLAHVFLSEPDTDFRMGNLLADIVKGRDLSTMSDRFLAGVRQHKIIDGFTDSHPIVHRSRARIRGDYRHTRGILVDVFYDHLLSLNFTRYATQSLRDFTLGVYAHIDECKKGLPPHARDVAGWMIAEDRLASYGSVGGVESALRLLSHRLFQRSGRVFVLERAITELAGNSDALRDDFIEFFPLLQGHVERASIAEARPDSIDNRDTPEPHLAPTASGVPKPN